MQPVGPHLTLLHRCLQVDALPCDTLKRVRDVYRQMQALYQAAASDAGKVGQSLHALSQADQCLHTSAMAALQSSHLLLLLGEAHAWWRFRQPMLALSMLCSNWPLVMLLSCPSSHGGASSQMMHLS